MKTITLKPVHFGRQKRCSLMLDAVSNGHWAIRRERIANVAMFVSIETAEAFIGAAQTTSAEFAKLAGPDTPSEWNTTPWLYDCGREGVGRVLVRGDAVALVRREYLAMFDADNACTTLYGDSSATPFRDAATIADSSIIMTMKAERLVTLPAAVSA